MNKQPVRYLQTDPRWRDKPYQVPGERATIGDSGCGPTAAAMLIETLTGRTYTPEDACKWSMDHGYKALHQGTYYGYFAPQFAAFGIRCWQLSWTNAYHNPQSRVHDQAMEYLKQGYYLIALMKKGNWTGSGHFVVVWWEDGKVRIRDPASILERRVNGDVGTFRNECAYYWVVDARAYNGTTEKEDDMDQEKFNRMFATAMQQYRQGLRDNECSPWSQRARQFAVDRGIFSGGDPGPDGQPNYMWEDLLTREQCAQVLYAFAETFGLA
ncbi:MAG: hypothetical protein HFF50_09705 [Lawsonibacter sp.]|nr:hypothetical protein [Lawsonibacter sp.]